MRVVLIPSISSRQVLQYGIRLSVCCWELVWDVDCWRSCNLLSLSTPLKKISKWGRKQRKIAWLSYPSPATWKRDLCPVYFVLIHILSQLSHDYDWVAYFTNVQGWRSGESTRFPPIGPGSDSQIKRHMWFSPGTPVSPLLKNQHLTWFVLILNFSL